MLCATASASSSMRQIVLRSSTPGAFSICAKAGINGTGSGGEAPIFTIAWIRRSRCDLDHSVQATQGRVSQ